MANTSWASQMASSPAHTELMLDLAWQDFYMKARQANEQRTGTQVASERPAKSLLVSSILTPCSMVGMV